MKNSNFFAVISGPSGVGKDTLIHQMMKRVPLQKFPAYTTRPMRDGEVDGVDYRFVSHRVFADLRERYEFLDCTELKGNFYGTPILEFQKAVEAETSSVIHLHASSALLLQRTVPLVKTIFVFPPSVTELERRLRHRGTPEQDIALRLQKAGEECECAIDFDFIVVNHTNEAAHAASQILEFLA